MNKKKIKKLLLNKGDFKSKVESIKIFIHRKQSFEEILSSLPKIEYIMEDIVTLPIFENDTNDTYQIRTSYANAALLYYGNDITLDEAIKIGFMAVDKIRYGVTYSDKYEKIFYNLSKRQ